MNTKTARNIIIISLIIVIVVVIFGIILTSDNSNTPVDSTSISTDTPDNQGGITSANFSDATAFEQVIQDDIYSKTDILFLNTGQLAYLNKNRNLTIQNTIVDESNRYNPLRIDTTPDGILINDYSKMFLYQNNGQTIRLPENILSIAPSRDKYVYIEENQENTNYIIKLSDSATLNGTVQTIGEISPQNSFEAVEVRNIGDRVYALFYRDNFTAIDIWQVVEGEVSSFTSLDNLFTFQVFDDFILYTEFLDRPNEVTEVGTNILDLRDPQRPITQELRTTQPLGQEDIFGDVVATRCDFDGGLLLYCLVKKFDVPHTFSAERDVIFTYNINNGDIRYPFSNLTFSAERVYISPQNEVYISSSTVESNNLYKLIN